MLQKQPLSFFLCKIVVYVSQKKTQNLSATFGAFLIALLKQMHVHVPLPANAPLPPPPSPPPLPHPPHPAPNSYSSCTHFAISSPAGKLLLNLGGAGSTAVGWVEYPAFPSLNIAPSLLPPDFSTCFTPFFPANTFPPTYALPASFRCVAVLFILFPVPTLLSRSKF